MRKYTPSLALFGLSLATCGMCYPPFMYVLGHAILVFLVAAISLIAFVLSVISFIANFVDTDECTKLVKLFSKLVNWNFYRKHKTDYTYNEYRQIRKQHNNVRFNGDRVILGQTEFGEKSIVKRTTENRTEYILFVNKEMIEHSTSLSSVMSNSRNAEYYYPSKLEHTTLMSGLPKELIEFFDKYKNIFYHWDGEKWYVANTPPNWHVNSSKEELDEIKRILSSNKLIMLISFGSSYICMKGKYGLNDPLNVEGRFNSRHGSCYIAYS